MKTTIILLTLGFFSFGQTSSKNIGEKIEGNFLGNGKKISATVIQTKKQKGNPIEDGTPAEFEIRFSDATINPIKAGCCEIKLINEGDLNQDETDEISVYQAPMNGCTYSMSSYTYTGGNWKKIIDTFLIPTGCENIKNHDLQKVIFRENNSVYYSVKNINDENGKLIKKKVKLK